MERRCRLDMQQKFRREGGRYAADQIGSELFPERSLSPVNNGGLELN